VADDLEPLQEDQQRQPEESVVDRWRRRQIERNYHVYRIAARRRRFNKRIVGSINNRRIARFRELSKAGAPALEQTRRFRRVKRRRF